MALKVYKFVTNSLNYKATVPSGLDSLSGVNNMRIKIKKPSGTIVVKNLVNTDIVAGTLNIQFLVGNGDFDEEGIYDYEVADTTSSADKKGKLLQFTVTREIQ